MWTQNVSYHLWELQLFWRPRLERGWLSESLNEPQCFQNSPWLHTGHDVVKGNLRVGQYVKYLQNFNEMHRTFCIFYTTFCHDKKWIYIKYNSVNNGKSKNNEFVDVTSMTLLLNWICWWWKHFCLQHLRQRSW